MGRSARKTTHTPCSYKRTHALSFQRDNFGEPPARLALCCANSGSIRASAPSSSGDCTSCILTAASECLKETQEFTLKDRE